MLNILFVKGGGTKNQTKRVAQNQIFSPSDAQEDSKFVFEKSANPLRL